MQSPVLHNHSHDDLKVVSARRSGICLPFVCKAFRSALQDLQHARLWGTICPLHYILPLHEKQDNIERETWQALRDWLRPRASVMHALHIKCGCRLHADMHPSPCKLHFSHCGATLHAVEHPSPAFECLTCRQPRIIHSCDLSWRGVAPWPHAMPKLTELVVDMPGAVWIPTSTRSHQATPHA